MGQVPGELVAAAFAVFNPEIVIPSRDVGLDAHRRTIDLRGARRRRDRPAATPARRLARRRRARADLLTRAVEPLRPEGRPLYAGVRSLAMPDSTLGAVWRMGDMLREYRGDSHTTAWVSAGFDATEIGLLTELFWGLPMRSYSRTRAWTNEQFDAAHERLRVARFGRRRRVDRAGRAVREDIEVHTDMQMAPAISALGPDIDELFAILGLGRDRSSRVRLPAEWAPRPRQRRCQRFCPNQ